MDLHAERAQHGGEADLLEGQPAGPGGGDDGRARSAPGASSCQRSSSPRRATSVRSTSSRRRQTLGPAPSCSSRRHRVAPGQRRRRARAQDGPVTAATSTGRGARCAAVTPGAGQRVLPAPHRQVGPQRVVGQDGCEAGGDALDVERVDDRRPAPAPTASRSCTLGTSSDATSRRPDPHGLERRQPVALGQGHVGEGTGAPVELRQHGVGDGPREDDAIGLMGGAAGPGPTPPARRPRACHGPGSERRTRAKARTRRSTFLRGSSVPTLRRNSPRTARRPRSSSVAAGSGSGRWSAPAGHDGDPPRVDAERLAGPRRPAGRGPRRTPRCRGPVPTRPRATAAHAASWPRDGDARRGRGP